MTTLLHWYSCSLWCYLLLLLLISDSYSLVLLKYGGRLTSAGVNRPTTLFNDRKDLSFALEQRGRYPHPKSTSGSMAVDLAQVNFGEPDYSSYSFHRSILPSYFIESLEAGEVTMPEVNQQFQPINDDIVVITTNNRAKGYVGCIFQLETSILCIERFYLKAFQLFLEELIEELQQDNKDQNILLNRFNNEEMILDTIGLPFRQVLIESYLPNIDMNNENQLNLLEKKFYLIFEKIIDYYKDDITTIPYFTSLIDLLQDEENTIVIMTNLPRYTAMKLLMYSSLSRFFEGRIPIYHFLPPKRDVFTIDFRPYLIEQKRREISSGYDGEMSAAERRDERDRSLFHHIHDPQYGDSYQSKQYALACGIMRKHSGLTMVFDRNSQNINVAKKLGMACIGLREVEDVSIEGLRDRRRSEPYNSFSLKLRGTDLQIGDYSEITIERIYGIMKRYVKWINGPALQRKETVKKPIIGRRIRVAYADDFPEEIAKDKARRLQLQESIKKRDADQRRRKTKPKKDDDEIDIGKEAKESFLNTYREITRQLTNEKDNLRSTEKKTRIGDKSQKNKGSGENSEDVLDFLFSPVSNEVDDNEDENDDDDDEEEGIIIQSEKEEEEKKKFHHSFFNFFRKSSEDPSKQHGQNRRGENQESQETTLMNDRKKEENERKRDIHSKEVENENDSMITDYNDEDDDDTNDFSFDEDDHNFLDFDFGIMEEEKG